MTQKSLHAHWALPDYQFDDTAYPNTDRPRTADLGHRRLTRLLRIAGPSANTAVNVNSKAFEGIRGVGPPDQSTIVEATASASPEGRSRVYRGGDRQRTGQARCGAAPVKTDRWGLEPQHEPFCPHARHQRFHPLPPDQRPRWT